MSFHIQQILIFKTQILASLSLIKLVHKGRSRNQLKDSYEGDEEKNKTLNCNQLIKELYQFTEKIRTKNWHMRPSALRKNLVIEQIVFSGVIIKETKALEIEITQLSTKNRIM